MHYQKIYIALLIVFTLNIHASDCPEAFDGSGKSDKMTFHLQTILRNQETIINQAKNDFTVLVVTITFINPESENFDTLTRDSLLFAFLQVMKKRFEKTSDLEQLSKKVDNLIPDVTSIIKNTPEHESTRGPTEALILLKEMKNDIETLKLINNEVAQFYQNRIEVLNTELTKPANRDKSIDPRIDIQKHLDMMPMTHMTASLINLLEKPISDSVTILDQTKILIEQTQNNLKK